MEISSKLVADLRAETGVGMMDCKKALVEAGGDFEEARKILRKKGLAAAARKADRATSEGLVVARSTRKPPCSSRSTARRTSLRGRRTSAVFAEGSPTRSRRTMPSGRRGPGRPPALQSLPAPGRATETVADAVSQLVAKLRREHPDPPVCSPRAAPRGAFRELRARQRPDRRARRTDSTSGDDTLGKDLAMHVAASDPRFASPFRSDGGHAGRRAGDRPGAGDAVRQAGQRRRADRGGESREVLPGDRAHRAGLRQGAGEDGRPGHRRAGGREALELRFVRFKLGEQLGRSGAEAEVPAGASA